MLLLFLLIWRGWQVGHADCSDFFDYLVNVGVGGWLSGTTLLGGFINGLFCCRSVFVFGLDADGFGTHTQVTCCAVELEVFGLADETFGC